MNDTILGVGHNELKNISLCLIIMFTAIDDALTAKICNY